MSRWALLAAVLVHRTKRGRARRPEVPTATWSHRPSGSQSPSHLAAGPVHGAGGQRRLDPSLTIAGREHPIHSSLPDLGPDECQEVGVGPVFVGRTQAVRRALVTLATRVLDQLEQ